jgi:hypothetical protein
MAARWTTATALVLFTAVLSYCQSTSIAPNVPEILSMHHQPFFWDVMGASVVGWVLGMVKGFSGSKNWLDHYWTNAPKPVLFILDLLVFVLCGAYVGTGIYHPDSFVAALGAGLTACVESPKRPLAHARGSNSSNALTSRDREGVGLDTGC